MTKRKDAWLSGQTDKQRDSIKVVREPHELLIVVRFHIPPHYGIHAVKRRLFCFSMFKYGYYFKGRDRGLARFVFRYILASRKDVGLRDV